MKEKIKYLLFGAWFIGHIATFIKLLLFDGYRYNWWNWIVAVPIDFFLSLMWPIYWAVLRPLFGA